MLGLARSFWAAYTEGFETSTDRWNDFECQSVRHLGACLLARVDGKSRVDYLTEDWQQELVRKFSRELLVEPNVKNIAACLDCLAEELSM